MIHISFVFLWFPISRDPPEGGTFKAKVQCYNHANRRFQFLGIPPKGELLVLDHGVPALFFQFPISRDPPEGGTCMVYNTIAEVYEVLFPISRDPPEGGTGGTLCSPNRSSSSFQFLGIPPKGEHESRLVLPTTNDCSFQFLGIPPKGELY